MDFQKIKSTILYFSNKIEPCIKPEKALIVIIISFIIIVFILVQNNNINNDIEELKYEYEILLDQYKNFQDMHSNQKDLNNLLNQRIDSLSKENQDLKIDNIMLRQKLNLEGW